MKRLMLIIAMIMLLSTPVYAEERGIHGEVSGCYGLTQGEAQVWLVDLYYSFNNWFSLGASQQTTTNGFGMIGVVPSFIPTSQLYEIYIKFDLEPIEVKISQWCKHPVWSSPKIDPSIANQGIYILMSYKF